MADGCYHFGARRQLLLKKNEEMEPKFIAGDQVRLISGGPKMTIRGLHFDVLAYKYKEDMFDCVWFDKNNDGKEEVHYCPFFTDELIKIQEAN